MEFGDKFKKDNKAPLWVLKYVPKENNRLSTLFDDLFEFTQKQNDDIDSKIVKNLLIEIKDKRLDIVNALNDVKKEDCLKLYVIYILSKENHGELNIEDCIKYLKSNLSGEIIFWSERDVTEFVKRFIDNKTKPIISKSEEINRLEPDNIENYTTEFDKQELDSKLNNPMITKEKLIKVLTLFVTKKPVFTKEIIELLDKEE